MATYSYSDIAKLIDHSLLQPTLTEPDLDAGCKLALAYDVASVCILPYYLKRCADILRGSTVQASTTIGFPHGGHTTQAKIAEARQAIADGGQELDMVVNISQVRSLAWDYVRQDIAAVIGIAHDAGAKVKVSFGSSPAIHGSLIIVSGDNDKTGSFLAALHRGTGRIVWRIARPDIDTYATPIVLRVAGRDQLLLGGCGWLTSYDPNTGELLWRCAGPTAETTANTVVADDSRVYVSGGYPKPYTLMCVRADGSGDVTATHRVWSLDKGMPYVPSPLYHDGLLYIADDWGIATCLEAATGKRLWQKRLGGDFTSSPIICGNRLFVINEAGLVFALATGKSFELLATSDLNESVMATPVICGGHVYVRTAKHLICLADRTTP